MIKSRRNKIVLFLTIAFISFQFIPLLGLGAFSDNILSSNQENGVDPKLINSKIPTQNDLGKIPSDSIPINELTVFDDDLRQFLSDLLLNQQTNSRDLRVILLFEENISKEKRIQIINSVFDDYQILGNYEVISGTYLKIKSDELLSKGTILSMALYQQHVKTGL